MDMTWAAEDQDLGWVRITEYPKLEGTYKHHKDQLSVRLLSSHSSPCLDIYPGLPYLRCKIWHLFSLNLMLLAIAQPSNLARFLCKLSLPLRESTVPSNLVWFLSWNCVGCDQWLQCLSYIFQKLPELSIFSIILSGTKVRLTDKDLLCQVR